MHAAVRGWAAGDSLGCRGQRLCGSGLLASGGVLELPHQTKRNSLLKCNVQGYMRSARAHAQTHAHTLSRSASIEALGEFFLRHLHMMEGREKGGGGGLLETRRWQEISPALRPVGLPSRQTCCRCRPRWRPSPFCWKESWRAKKKRRRRRRNLVRVEDWKLWRESEVVLKVFFHTLKINMYIKLSMKTVVPLRYK